MPDEIVAIPVSVAQQQRLAELIKHHPDLGKASGISLIEDELARAVWDALPA